jgi:hypothetical protein
MIVISQRRERFQLAAHSLTSLQCGLACGMAAVVLLRRRTDRLKRIQERADALIASDAQDEPIRKLR